MTNTDTFKKQLEKEFALLENEMKEVARKNPNNSGDWEPVETEIDSDHADETDVADNEESFMENKSVMDKLEPQYRDVKAALEKIKKGTYGICEVGGEEIPEARLKANPAARTCMEHAK